MSTKYLEPVPYFALNHAEREALQKEAADLRQLIEARGTAWRDRENASARLKDIERRLQSARVAEKLSEQRSANAALAPSDDERRSMLIRAVEARFGGGGKTVWIEALYSVDGRVIYGVTSEGPMGRKEQLYSATYTVAKDGKVTLAEPTPVVRRTEYVEVVGNQVVGTRVVGNRDPGGVRWPERFADRWSLVQAAAAELRRAGAA